MYIIMVYDVQQKRVQKVLKKGREYLNWVQNSVLEGELTEKKFKQLKKELLEIIDEESDSLIFYHFRKKEYTRREVFGEEKGGEQLIY